MINYNYDLYILHTMNIHGLYAIWLCMHIVEHFFMKEAAHVYSAHSSVSMPHSPKLMVWKRIWPDLVLHSVLNIIRFCPDFVRSPGMPWQESVLLDRCEERNRGCGHHLRFCEHSHQDPRCKGCRWCWAGQCRRTWNCENRVYRHYESTGTFKTLLYILTMMQWWENCLDSWRMSLNEPGGHMYPYEIMAFSMYVTITDLALCNSKFVS